MNLNTIRIYSSFIYKKYKFYFTVFLKIRLFYEIVCVLTEDKLDNSWIL